MTSSLRRAFIVALAVAFIVPAVAIASWPVASSTSYVSQYYHSRHKAIDIASKKWTKVKPIRSGKVVFAGWKNNCGGYQVWVSHGSGLYTAYYHLAREVVYKGKAVTRQSTTLGYVGTTGCASGPHLHLEVWRGFPWRSGSYRVNPWSYVDSGTYLPKRYR